VPRHSNTVADVLFQSQTWAAAGTSAARHRLDEDTVASEDRLRGMELIVCKIPGRSQLAVFQERALNE
jgi:hypothetical protein